MRQRGTQLRRVGVMFNDMTNVFVDHPATIYKDDCCHLNVAGDAILARAIGREIRESWDESKLELSPEMTEPNRDP